jgi:hypothetical protein
MRPEAERAIGSKQPTSTPAVEAHPESRVLASLNAMPVQSPSGEGGKHAESDDVIATDRYPILAKLAKRIRLKLGAELPEAVQSELATLLGLVPEASGSHSLCFCEFEIAVDALLADKPKLELARRLRMKFEEQMWAKRFGGSFVRALPATRVVFGLVLTSILLLAPLIWSTCKHFSDGHPEVMDVDLLVLVCCFGAFGAVASIMVRLRSFDTIHGLLCVGHGIRRRVQ